MSDTLRLNPTAPCFGCGVDHAERRCPRCGFDRARARLSWRLIGQDLAHHVLNWEAPAWRTVRGLFVRPGKTIAAYVDGPRRTVVNPLKYCLVMGSLTIAAGKLFAGERPAFVPPPDAPPERIRRLESVHEFNLAMADWAHLFTFALLPFLAVSLRAFFPRQGRTTVEHLTFSLFVFGQSFLIQALLMPFTSPSRTWAVIFSALPIVYFVWCATTFYRGRWWWVAIRALLADLLMYTAAAIVGLLLVRVLAT